MPGRGKGSAAKALGDADARLGEGAARLRSRALVGSLWVVSGYGGRELIRLANNLILTRLLFPEAFGFMAIVNVILLGLAMFADIGLPDKIVQSNRGEERRFLDTAWTLQILRGGFLFLVSCWLAWPLARFYDEPSLLGMLPVAGTALLIGGFRSTWLSRSTTQRE